MTIQWLGQSCFKVQTKSGGEEITLITDPFDDATGIKMPRVQADIVTVSHEHHDHNNVEAIKGEPFLINSPGEYERQGTFVYGILGWHDDKQSERNIMYKISSEDINLLHLGDMGKELTDDQLEKIGDVDVLLIPIGGNYTIDYKKALEVIAQIEPKIAIPMHYKTADNKASKLAAIDDFLKHCGMRVEKTDKLKLTKKDLANEDTRVVVLEI